MGLALVYKMGMVHLHGLAIDPARRGVGQGRRAAASQRIQPTIFDPMSDNSDAEEDWQPGSNAGSALLDHGISFGDSDASDKELEAQSLLWELGEYRHRPWPNEDSAVRYCEENWHVRT